ncbi:hypothetical protein ACNQ2A_02170 [Mycoplasma sp. 1458C]|uniref:hypothetical protein n=1 Tax=Mycoplasma sp. 1458C TaxID=3401661 RepID=UPI003AAFDF59
MMQKNLLITLSTITLPVLCTIATNCNHNSVNNDRNNKNESRSLKIGKANIPSELSAYIKRDNVGAKITDKDYYKLMLKAYTNICFLKNTNVDQSSEQAIRSIDSEILNEKDKQELINAVENLDSLSEIVDNDFAPFKMKKISSYHGFEATIAKKKITKAEHLFLLMCNRLNDIINNESHTSLTLKRNSDMSAVPYKIWDLVQMILWATSNGDCLLVNAKKDFDVFVPTIKLNQFWDKQYIEPSCGYIYNINFEKVNDNPYAKISAQIAKQIIDWILKDKIFMNSSALPNDYDVIFDSNENAIKYINFKKEVQSKLNDKQEIFDIIFYY